MGSCEEEGNELRSFAHDIEPVWFKAEHIPSYNIMYPKVSSYSENVSFRQNSQLQSIESTVSKSNNNTFNKNTKKSFASQYGSKVFVFANLKCHQIDHCVNQFPNKNLNINIADGKNEIYEFDDDEKISEYQDALAENSLNATCCIKVAPWVERH